MPKKLPSDLLEHVQTALAQHPEGLGLADVARLLESVASRRTLQRRLDEWVREQKIAAKGVRRGRLYFEIARPTNATAITPPTALGVSENRPDVQGGIPLSLSGERVQALVRKPITEREPVGFKREFLESYLPNKTEYLSKTVKSHLAELGRTPDEQRPAGTYARDILDRLLIDFSWSSSRLEGNTYSLLDTRELIERGTAAAGKDAKETQMILNHKAAIEFLVESAEDIGVNRYTVLNLHALLADNLLEDSRNAGRLRVTPVAIGASTYLPTASPQLIEEMFARVLDTASAISDPFEQSFFLLVQLPYLQPFVDVNKRTSRLASNIPFIKHNLVPLSFIDVPERTYIDGLIGIYERNGVELLRDVFVWAYERSARRYKTVRDSLPEPDPFRLKYRTALIEVIGEAVRNNVPVTADDIGRLSQGLVPADDVAQFAQLTMSELRGLHEGNIARFRLRSSEFQRWIDARR